MMGKILSFKFKKSKVKLKVVDSTRPTTNKNTIIANDYKLLKVDTLDNQPIQKKFLKEFNQVSKMLNAMQLFLVILDMVFSTNLAFH